MTPHAFSGNTTDFVFFSAQPNQSIFERQDVQMAISEFCRMLSLNPENKTVRGNLSAILSYSGLTAKQRSDVFLLEDLLGYIENLEGRLDYLISKRDLLRNQLVEKGYDDRGLSRDLANIKNDIPQWHETLLPQDRPFFNQNDPIVFINAVLADEKAQLSMRVRSLQNQYDWMKEANKDKWYFSQQYIIRSADASDSSLFGDIEGGEEQKSVSFASENEKGKRKHLSVEPPEKKIFSTLDSNSKTIAEVIALESKDVDGKLVQKENLSKFKKELGSLYVQLDEFQERIGEKDSRLNELSRQVVDLSLRLSEAEMLLNEKLDIIGSLRKQSADIQQRFALGERIIQEKDAQMQSLHESLEQVQSEAKKQKEAMESVAASMNQQLLESKDFLSIANGQKEELKELKGILNIYQQNLGDMNRAFLKKSHRMDSLKNEHDRLNKELRQAIFFRNQKIDKLREQLVEIRKDLAITRRIVQKNGEHLHYAGNGLGMVPLKMDIEQKEGDAKVSGGPGLYDADKSQETKLTELSGILNIYKDKLSKENRAVEEKTADIVALEKKLTFMGEKLKEKNKALVKTQHDLLDLEGQLKIIKGELLELKGHSNQSELQDHNVENEFKKLQSKFRDVQNFLLENLHDSDRINTHLAVSEFQYQNLKNSDQ